jgi:anti-sigma-K factor RskA
MPRSARAIQLFAQGTLADYKIATLASLLGNSPQAVAVAIWNPASQEGVLTVQKLPALAADKDYQLWVIDPQYSIPVDGGVFKVDPTTGEGRLVFHPNRPVQTVAKFAVSLERKGGVPKAEGPMVLIGP